MRQSCACRLRKPFEFPCFFCSRLSSVTAVSADWTEVRVLLQMHNGGFRQCCHAASAYALLTYFRAESVVHWQNGQTTLPFAAKLTTVASVSGSVRTKTPLWPAGQDHMAR
jgi:hypothetical protein